MYINYILLTTVFRVGAGLDSYNIMHEDLTYTDTIVIIH